MGIDGTEATGVLSVLSDGVGRLETALALSNKAFEAGDYHMKEAAKSYATQESALGRLGCQTSSRHTDNGILVRRLLMKQIWQSVPRGDAL